MKVILVSLDQAGDRLDAGERVYEYQTDDKALRIMGPGCGFGNSYLQQLRRERLYAETLQEARAYIETRNASLIGIWFVLRQ
ncbi:MAG: hypothetical protein IPM66_21745 [Acidobacteriota bacterium]|nr:MAG: hypothetical protein IPM66_21745 [Acidobacteriota bacterium]